MSRPTQILSNQLKLSDVPVVAAARDVIWRFALTFDRREMNPYEIKNQDFTLWTEHSTLIELRARLYVEQRRWNHFGRPPDNETMDEVRRLVRLIRDKVIGCTGVEKAN